MAAGERAIEGLLDADPAPDHITAGSINWLDLQTQNDAFFPDGARAYFKSLYFDELSDDVIATLIEHTGQRHSPIAGLEVHQLGGAFGRVDEGATAFGNRNAQFT